MRLRYSLKTLLITLAVVAISCFFLIQNYRQHRLKDIPQGMYGIKSAINEKGVTVEIISNADPIKEVAIKVLLQDEYYRPLMFEIVKFDSVLEKTIRIEKGDSDQPVVESSQGKTQVLLPKTFEGVSYSFDAKTGIRSQSAILYGITEVFRLKNDLQKKLVVVVYIR